MREAAEQFSLAVRANPHFFSARANLAAVELRLGALDDAIANLKILSAAQPENETIRKRLAEAMEARGEK